jgi:hypothetical protein
LIRKMKRSKKHESEIKEVGMSEKAVKETGGLCCPHCSDSKFPCVNMERLMRKGEEEKVDTIDEEKDS